MRYWNGLLRPPSRSIKARLSALDRHNISTFPVAATRERTISMSVYKRGGRWHYTKTIDGVRYRGALKTARNKAQAEQAEAKIVFQIHQGEHSPRRSNRTLKDFVDKVYLPWSKTNKRSYRNDVYRVKPIEAFFKKMRMCDISPFLIEKFKRERLNTPVVSLTKTKPRSVASVNREISLLSKILSLAAEGHDLKDNPCHSVKLLKGEKNRTRYASLEEEERLFAVMTGRRAHLRDIVELYAICGLRQMELLSLTVTLVDLHRDVVYVKDAKGYVDREVPLSERARELFRK